MPYSQNNEELYILEHFKGFTGTLLDIGANDGKTFSNSLALIGEGWSAVLVEPCAEAYMKLSLLHEYNDKVRCIPVAIGKENGKTLLHVNDPHIDGDTGLLSTLNPDEKKRWGSLPFNTQEVEVFDFKTLCNFVEKDRFDFITIDCEGLDYDVLSQIDLTHTKMVCVEHNGKEIEKYSEYCKSFGMRILHINGENIICVK